MWEVTETILPSSHTRGMTVASMLPVWHVQGSILIVKYEDGQDKQYTDPSWFKFNVDG